MLKALYYLSLISLALGQLLNISKSGGTNIYIFDAVVLFSAALGLIHFLAVTKKFKIPASSLYLAGFIFVGLVSLFLNNYKYSADELLVSLFYGLRFVGYLTFAAVVYNMVLTKKISQDEIQTSITWSGVFLVLLGIIQLIILPDFEQLDSSLGWDPHKNRLASTFFDPNFVGAYIVLCMIFAVEKFKKVDAKSVTIFTTLLLGIVLTFSRSAWLMLAVFVFIYGLLKNRKLLFAALLIMFLAYYSVPRIQTRISGTTDPADSAQFRWTSWSNTLEIVKDAPIVGVGYNTLRYVQKDYGFIDEDTFLKHSAAGSDSSLLFVWATAGVVGLLLFLAGFLSPLWSKDNLTYKLMAVALLIESQFINSLFYPQIMFVWMIFLALSYRQRK